MVINTVAQTATTLPSPEFHFFGPRAYPLAGMLDERRKRSRSLQLRKRFTASKQVPIPCFADG